MKTESKTCSDCYEPGGSCGRHPQPVHLCPKHAAVDGLIAALTNTEARERLRLEIFESIDRERKRSESPPTLTLTTAALRRILMDTLDAFGEDGSGALMFGSEDEIVTSRPLFVDAVLEAVGRE